MTPRKDDFDLDDLRSAMTAATPAADPARRAENLALAKKNFQTAQGSRAEARQSSDRPQTGGFFKGAFDMLISRTALGGLTATTALVAVGFLFLSPQGQNLLRPPVDSGPSISEPEIVTGVDREQAQDTGVSEDGDLAVADTSEEVGRVTLRDTEQVETAPLILAEPMAPPSPAPTDGLFSLYSSDDVGGGAIQQQGYGNSAVLNSRGVVAPGSPIASPDIVAPPPADTEEYANADDNPLRVVADDPVSTFSIDVDTASWSLLRSSLNRGQMPNPDAVRIEEMINYFPYDYAAPDADDISPFRPTVNVFETPWNPDTRLVRIGLQGDLPAIEDRPALNLVFLIDTSGSMNDPSKLPLLIQSFRLMLDRLDPEDEVAIVTYAGSAGVALDPTPASDREAIEAALTRLQAGGSTNGAGGLREAYRLASEMSEEGEVSRVLLATDGDFNVGISNPDELTDFIEDQRDSGTYLSVLGFGRGNLQDDTMQALAQNGNGTAAYIDTLSEARRVLVDQLAGALFPIADDVKIQVEFNPAVIAEYRLIGYETRALAREDFNNDDVDAGELGAGHSVTALYEVTPVGSPARLTDPLRYASDTPEAEAADHSDELGFLRLRWKEPGAEESELIEFPIEMTDSPDPEAAFAAAIAGFGQLLRGSDFLGDWTYADAIALANANRGEDEFGYRFEAVQLMRLAESLDAD
ncbi:von Willebrand factor A [Roseovarius sp. JS7-11]|jgi:Ca-activated chloride channel family protein|nr:VWA domain-containing protein [Nioella sediminis]TBX22960.1 von Willebrand factor A [Roseovarius sp. JS7-11]